MTEEIWKDIKLDGFENCYQVSSLGNVRSLDREFIRKGGRLQPVKGRVLKKQTDRYGYNYVIMYNQGLEKKMTIHRLVAMAFIPNGDEERNQVNHIDSVRSNNRVDNLEWVTGKENSEHAYEFGNGIRGFDHHEAKSVLIEKDDIPISLFGSLAMMSESFNIPRKTLRGYINDNKLLFDELSISFTEIDKSKVNEGIIEHNFIVNPLSIMNKKPVAIFDKNNNLLSVYQDRVEAEKTNGIVKTGLCYSKSKGSLYKKNFYIRDITQYKYITYNGNKINLRVIFD